MKSPFQLIQILFQSQKILVTLFWFNRLILRTVFNGLFYCKNFKSNFTVFESPKKTQKYYEIPIFASDGPKFGDDRKVEASIKINVLDTNDNIPLFDQSEYDFQISENAAFNTTIGIISATDLDTTSLGKLKYFIQGVEVPNGTFLLDFRYDISSVAD